MKILTFDPTKKAQLIPILEADRADDHTKVCNAVAACAKKGIKPTMIETFLRQNQCRTYLVAQPTNKAVHRSIDKTANQFVLSCANDPKKVRNYAVNFLRLDECDFSLVNRANSDRLSPS